MDDNSTDGTKDILRKFNNYTILFHNKNMGKGTAIETGLKYTDADLEYNPIDYNKILPAIINNQTLVAYGSRLSNKKI